MNKTYHLSIRNKRKTVRHKDWCTQLDSKNVKMNLRKYRKKWKNLGNKYVASENKNKFIFKKTTRKVGSGETKKVPLHPPNHPSFFPPYMLHTLLNTFLKLLRYSKYWGGKAFSSVLTELYWVLVSTQQTGTAWIWGEGEKFTDVLKRWKQ